MIEAVIFGAGQVCAEILPVIEKQFHVLYIVDNNEKFWGTKFKSYDVKAPSEAVCIDRKIVIASTRYAFEIAEQLKQMGMDEEAILMCRGFYAGKRCTYDIHPVNEKLIPIKDTQLSEFDALKNEEAACRQTNVLIGVSFLSVFAVQLIANLSKRYQDIEFSILTSDEKYHENAVVNKLKHLYIYKSYADLKTILTLLPTYDVIHFLWIETEWSFYADLARRKAKRLVLTVGGSDFYRASELERAYKRKLILSADYINLENSTTRKAFIKYYGQEVSEKTKLVPYGMELLDDIDRMETVPDDTKRKELNIPPNKIIVTCGYNAHSAHQHLKLVEALGNISDDVKEKIVCVFPMTYPSGQDVYIQSVSEALNKNRLGYVIFTNFMPDKQIAQYATLSDIMIHVQITDALSSSMREEMYCGAVVIAGKWLPYDILREKGIYFVDAESVADVPAILEEVVNNLEFYKSKCRNNRYLIRNEYSWDAVAAAWHGLWKDGIYGE